MKDENEIKRDEILDSIRASKRKIELLLYELRLEYVVEHDLEFECLEDKLYYNKYLKNKPQTSHLSVVK